MKKLENPRSVDTRFGQVAATHELHHINLIDGPNPQLTSSKQLGILVNGVVEAIPGTELTINFQGETLPLDGWTLKTISDAHDAAYEKQMAFKQEAIETSSRHLQEQIAQLEADLAALKARG